MRCATELSSAICSARCWLCRSDRRRASFARSSSRAFCAACSACSWVSRSRRCPSSSLARSSASRRRAGQLGDGEHALAGGVAVGGGDERGQAAAIEAREGLGPPLQAGPRVRTGRPLARFLLQQLLHLAAAQAGEQLVQLARARLAEIAPAGRGHVAEGTQPGFEDPVPLPTRGGPPPSGAPPPAGSTALPLEHVRDAAGERLPAHAHEAGALHERAELGRRGESRHRCGQVGVGRAVAADPTAEPREDDARVGAVEGPMRPPGLENSRTTRRPAGRSTRRISVQRARARHPRCGCRTPPAPRRTPRRARGGPARRPPPGRHEPPCRPGRACPPPAPASGSTCRGRRPERRTRGRAPR